jgi:hypothetical protein
MRDSGCRSGGPASLLVRVIRRSLVIAVPLFRLLVGRARDGADRADREQETSPDESEHPKYCEHTKRRRNEGAGVTGTPEFSPGQKLSAIGYVDPPSVALSSCSEARCSTLQCVADASSLNGYPPNTCLPQSIPPMSRVVLVIHGAGEPRRRRGKVYWEPLLGYALGPR